MKKVDLDDLSHAHSSPKAAIDHAIEWLSSLLERPSFNAKPGGLTNRTMRRDFPYVIHDTKIVGTQILVNRQYKPVGSILPTTGQHVVYEEFPNLHIHLSPEQIRSVVSPPHARGLFGDGNPPWHTKASAKEYLERLRRLRALLS